MHDAAGHDRRPDDLQELRLRRPLGRARLRRPETGGQNTPDGGAYVVDISDPAAPREVGFIATSQDTLVGEGMQGLTLTTAAFNGDVLLDEPRGVRQELQARATALEHHEPAQAGEAFEHAGDLTVNGVLRRPARRELGVHSAFA